jgi:hypothetical protein
MAVIAGVPDTKALGMLHPAPELVWRDAEYLREHRLSMFATGLEQELGKPVSTVYSVALETNCVGAIETVEPVPARDLLEPGGLPGARISGWAVSHDSRGPQQAPVLGLLGLKAPLRLVIAAVDGKIAGFAVTGFPRRDRQKGIHSNPPANSGWTGYVRIAPGAEVIDVFGLAAGLPESLCRIARVSVPKS